MKVVPKIRRHTQWLPHQISSFFSRARRIYQSPLLDIRRAAQTNPEHSQLLIVTPRKMGNAPQRNLFKRRIRAIFDEQNLHNCGYDIGVFAKAGAHTIPFSELVTLMVAACKKPTA